MLGSYTFKNASGVLAAAWSNALHSSTDHACDPPEALSWKEIGLPPRRNCHNSPPMEVGVLSSFKIKSRRGLKNRISPIIRYLVSFLQEIN